MFERLQRALRPDGAGRSVIFNAGWLIADRVLRIGLGVLVGAWIARHLGPTMFGQLAYVLALLGLFQAFCSLGLDGPAVRDIAQSPDQAGTILGSTFAMRVAAGLFGWIAAIALVFLLRPDDPQALLMMAVAGAALVLQPAEAVDLWLQSQGKSRLSIPYRFSAYLGAALGRVALIVNDAPLWSFAAATAVEASLVAIALWRAFRQLPCDSAWQSSRATALQLLAESWPLMLSAVSIGIYMRIDQIILRELADEHQLGLYSAVMPFSQAWHMIPMTLCASMLPRLAQLRDSDPIRYRLRLQQSFTFMAWSGIAAAVGTSLAAPWLVGLLLGPQYAESVPVLRWHAFTNVFVFLGVAQSLAIVTERTPLVALSKTAVGALISVVANVFLVPRWGATGAAAGALISYMASAMLMNAFVARDTFKMQLRAFVPLRHVSN